MSSPMDREILSHYYCGPTEFERIEAPACIEAIKSFVVLGLLVKLPEPNEYGATYAANHPALEVYMRALDAVPYPVNKWTMPYGELRHWPACNLVTGISNDCTCNCD